MNKPIRAIAHYIITHTHTHIHSHYNKTHTHMHTTVFNYISVLGNFGGQMLLGKSVWLALLPELYICLWDMMIKNSLVQKQCGM